MSAQFNLSVPIACACACLSRAVIIPSAQGEREAGQRDALLVASTSSARATAARAILLEARAARGHTLLLSIVVLFLACRFSFLLSNRFNHGRRATHTMAANPSFFPAFNPRPPSPTQHALTSTLNDPTSAVLTVRCAAPLFGHLDSSSASSGHREPILLQNIDHAGRPCYSVVKSFPYRTMKALVLKNVDLLEAGGVGKLRERCLKGASPWALVLLSAPN